MSPQPGFDTILCPILSLHKDYQADHGQHQQPYDQHEPLYHAPHMGQVRIEIRVSRRRMPRNPTRAS